MPEMRGPAREGISQAFCAISSPEGLPLPSDVESHESHDNGAGDDGKGVLERTGGIEAGEDENKTPDDVSAEQHKSERCRPPPHGQDEQPGCYIKKADHSG